MDTLFQTTAFTVGVETLSSSSTYVIEDDKVCRDRVEEVLSTTLAVTSAILTTGVADNFETKKEAEMCSRAYVESMSDKELEQALQKMNLLAEEQALDEDVKTL